MISKKKLFFVGLVIFLIVGLSVVSAHENNTDTVKKISQKEVKKTSNTINTKTNSKDKQSNVTKKVTNEKNNIKKTNKKNVKTATEKTVSNYQELYNTLTSNENNDVTVTLDGENKYQITQTITLNDNIKKLVINGNSKTIDGNGENKFLIVNHPSNITINKLTISNCKNIGDDTSVSGGAISVKNSNLTLNNVKFNKNALTPEFSSTNPHGGAFSAIESNVNIIDSDFNDNYILTENDNYYYGGALFLKDSTLNVVNSTFLNNSFMSNDESDPYSYYHSYGGAIFAINTNITVDKSSFKINKAMYGAAVSTYPNDDEDFYKVNIKISNSVFDENGIPPIDGEEEYMGSYGALRIGSTGTTYINNVNFTKNYGTAINNYKNVLIIDNSSFIENGNTMDEFEGGAIFNELANLSVNNSKFIKNKIPECECQGGAIYNYGGNLSVDYSLFDENCAGYHGGAIASILYYKYIYESYNDYYEYYQDLVIINHTNFTNNKVEYRDYSCEGGAIYTEGENIFIENSNFDGNNASGSGAVLYAEPTSFRNYIDGRSITVYVISNITINNSNFTNNGVFNKEVSYYNGGIIYTCDVLSINNSNFISNNIQIYQDYNGGVIYAGGELNITNTLFKDNSFKGTYSLNGGAVYCEGETLIDNCEFISNKIYGEYTINGGAIYANYDISIVNSIFESNELFTSESDSYGGALYLQGYSYINNTEFISNIAHNTGSDEAISMGGAIYANSELTINNSKFHSNRVNTSSTEEVYVCGGAIFTQSYLYVDNTEFISNTAESTKYDDNYDVIGGSIYTDYPKYIYVNNSIFIDNAPINFVIKNDKIYLNCQDNFIPDWANVTISDDENPEGRNYTLMVSEDDYNIIYIPDYVINADAYMIKMVLTELDTSSYYMDGRFYNNTFYLSVPQNLTLSVKAEDVKVLEETNISGKLYYYKNNGDEKVLPNFEIELYINGTFINKTITDENGEYIFTYKTEVVGLQDVLVKLSNAPLLQSVSNNTTFNVIKRESYSIITVNNNVNLGEKVNINIKFYDDDSKPIKDVNITIFVDDNKYDLKTDNNGNCNIQYKTINAGKNFIIVIYDGNEYYTSNSNSTTFIVNKIGTVITVKADDTFINKATTITGKLTDANNNVMTNQPVTLCIDKEKVNVTTDKNGQFTYKYTAKLIGENHISVFFEGNDKYQNCFNNSYFIVKKIATSISIKATNTTVNKTTKITGKLTNKDNKPIIKAQINIIFDGKVIAKVTTDNNGQYSYNYKTVNNGTFNVTVIFAGDENNTSINKTTKITVKPYLKTKTTIVVKSKKINNGDKVTLEATVKDKNGKPVNDGKVVFKINLKSVQNSKGKVIYVNVKKGVAKVTITPNKGLYNKNSDLNAVYGGTAKYQSASSNTAKLLLVKREATIKFPTKNITTKAEKTVALKVIVKDKDGSNIKTGKVQFKINSKTIGVAKIKNGIATLKYNIAGKTSKVYKITAVYSSVKYKRVQKTTDLIIEKIPTKINVKPITTSSSTFTVKAKITDEKNKQIKSKTKVSIKIGGKTYISEKTVKNGKINIKIPSKLKKGTYTLSIVSGSTKIYEQSNANTKLTITQ